MDHHCVERNLFGYEINILIEDIAKEKFCFVRTEDPHELSWTPQRSEDFDDYRNFPCYTFNAFPGPLKTPGAQELLTEYFKDRAF